MKKTTQHRVWPAGCAIIIALTTGHVCSQDAASYPSKPVRVILGLAPGGSTDILARQFSQKLTESLHQPFIVENRPSAGSTIALGMVAKAAPDGYTLHAADPTLTVAPSFFRNMPADALTDLAPVSLMIRAPYMMVVHPSVPAKSVTELVALAKSRPGKLNFSGAPNGTIIQLASLWFFSLARINVAYVPYKGTGPSLIALVGGETDASVGNVLSMLPYVQSGRLRAVGITSTQRSTAFPNMPTVAEQGVPGYELITFHGWLAPAGTPAATVNKLSTEIARIVTAPEIAGKLKSEGAEAVGSTPEQFRQLITAQLQRWSKVAQDKGIKPE